MLFYLNNAYSVTSHFPIDLYALSSLIEVCVLFNTNCAQHTLNAIGHCIVWFVFGKLVIQ